MVCYDWNLFLDFALKICNSNGFDDETVSRVAVSRAYYAAFHIAEHYLLNRGVELGYVTGSHETVCTCFKEMNQGNKEYKSSCRTIGNMLLNLKKERVKADYKSDVTISRMDAIKNCKQAQKIIGEICRLKTIS